MRRGNALCAWLQGIQYLLGDFRVKVCVVKSKSEAKGFMVEVEYSPIASLLLSQQALQVLRSPYHVSNLILCDPDPREQVVVP